MNLGLGVSLLAWVIKKVINKEVKINQTPYDRYIILFLIALLFSFVDSLNLVNSLDYLQRFLIPIILFYLLVDVNPSLKVIRTLLVILFAAILFSLGQSLLQFYSGVARVHGNIFVMEFASILSFFLLYLISYICWGRISLIPRIILGLLSIIGISSLIFTQTRGVWLAFLASLVLIIFIKNKSYLLYFLILVLIFVAVAPQIIPNQYINRFISIFDFKENKSNVTRLNLWRGALLIYRDHWVNGIGLNNFSEVIIKEPYYQEPMVSTAHAHNNFLQLAAETGTIGLISFILLFGFILKDLYVNYKLERNYNLKLFFLASLGTIISYLAHGLTEYNLEDRFVGRLIWFIIAINLILGQSKENNNQGRG
ncbi:O-antigen ligase family protein [Orenia metallireducens]|nr:O-antigen ligase family protein [Orenia metallireducens]